MVLGAVTFVQLSSQFSSRQHEVKNTLTETAALKAYRYVFHIYLSNFLDVILNMLGKSYTLAFFSV